MHTHARTLLTNVGAGLAAARRGLPQPLHERHRADDADAAVARLRAVQLLAQEGHQAPVQGSARWGVGGAGGGPSRNQLAVQRKYLWWAQHEQATVEPVGVWVGEGARLTD